MDLASSSAHFQNGDRERNYKVNFTPRDHSKLQLKLGHLADAFYPKRLKSANTHIDTPTAESTMHGDSQLVRSG